MGLQHDLLAAFHFDAAVWTFGSELDEELRAAMEPTTGRRGKPLTAGQQYNAAMAVLERWLGIPGLKKYRDPAAGRGK